MGTRRQGTSLQNPVPLQRRVQPVRRWLRCQRQDPDAEIGAVQSGDFLQTGGAAIFTKTFRNGVITSSDGVSRRHRGKGSMYDQHRAPQSTKITGTPTTP